MKINVMSLRKANELIQNEYKYQKNWISIRENDFPELYNKFDVCNNVCIVIFDDVTYYSEKHNLSHKFFDDIRKRRNLIHFNDEHARKIIKFSTNIFYNNEDLNIHCFAGRSRSQAVGYVLNQYFNLYLTHNPDDYRLNILNNNEKFMANPDVIKVMNNVLYEEVLK